MRIIITEALHVSVNDINHFDLRSDFENDNVLDVMFTPQGKTSAEPEEWAIETRNFEGIYLDTYLYDSKSEYEADVKFLELATTKIIKGHEYLFTDLEKYSAIHEMDLECHGQEIIGEHFVVMKDEKNQTMSFIYKSYIDSKGGYFQCIYSDFHYSNLKKYLVFGDEASKSFFNTSGVQQIIDDSIEFAIHCFDRENSSAIDNLLSAFEGWGGYAEISKDEFDILKNIETI